MGISGIRSKQLRAPYGVSRARWVNKDLTVQLFVTSMCLSHDVTNFIDFDSFLEHFLM